MYLFKTVKVRIIFIFIAFFIGQIYFSSPVLAQKKNYSIDRKVKKRKPKHRNNWFKNLFRPTTEAEAIKKARKEEEKKEKERIEQERKSVEAYQKRANKGKEQGQSRSVYKRMKQYEKESKRVREHKRPKNFFQRLFSGSSKRKTKKVKRDE